jgi:hypothetical protein
MNGIHFYDAATPQNVPSGVYAGVYVNGFTWPRSQVERMARVFRISVMRQSFWAKYARCLDMEAGAAVPEIDLVPFIRERKAHHFDDATGYVNRSNWLTAIEACHHGGEPEPLWWVATLDGTMIVERPAGAPPGPGAWAVQYGQGPGQAYDLSVLHGINNLHKP